jgi:hypothetical protein
MQILFSLVESPFHPNFAALYRRLDIVEIPFSSARNLHKALHKQTPDFFVGDFIYGWANNYAGTNLSNLDVTLTTLQQFAPEARVIVFTEPGDEPHLVKLKELFPVHAALRYSASEKEMQSILELKPE